MKDLKSVLIILIGNELLNGSIQDKNAKLLLTKLSLHRNLSLQVMILPDTKAKIIETIHDALPKFDLIVTSGGLGPTTDDLTIESICEALGKKSVQDQNSLKRLKEKYEKRGRPLTENSIKQTYFPEGSRVLVNEVGTADSCLISHNNSFIACFPGVPKEFEYFINGEFWNWLENEFPFGSEIAINHFRIFGISEAYIGSKIEALKLSEDITVAYRPQFPEVLVSLKSNSIAQEDLDKIKNKTIDAIGREFLLGEKEDLNLPTTLLTLLENNNLTLSTAESCTGGRTSSEITKIPGSSKSFLGGVICYSNELKSNLLRVPINMLEKHGAVSEEVALELAKNMQRLTKSTYAISITGVSGPDGGTSDKPVGLVFIGIATPDSIKAFKYQLPWDRVRNQIYSTWLALDLIRRSILNFNLTWELK